MLIGSIFLLSFCVAFYIGIKSWGAPLNIALVKSGLHDLSAMIALASSKIGFCLLFIISVSGIYLSYVYSSKKLFNNPDSDIKRAGNNMFFKAIFLPVLLLAGILFSQWSVGSNNKKKYKYEIFSSFFKKSKKLQRIEKLDLGLNNVPNKFKKVEDFDRKNVIIFSVDCLRADHLSMNGYGRQTSPFLDSLYTNGKLKKFNLSTSTCASSFCGILSMLNSKDLQNLSLYKYGIHDYLKDQGYKTNFILSGIHGNWYNIKSHYGPNIDHYIEGKDKPDFNVHDDALIVNEVEGIKDYIGEPNFFFFHFMGPHTLGMKDTIYEQYKPVIEKSLIRKIRLSHSGSEDLQKLYRNNYDNGIYQTDNYIRKILDSLKDKGYLENSIVVIAGDHGESIGENSDYLGHGNALTDEYLNIPILFIDDNIEVYRQDLYATQIDIAPTIISRLGLPIPDIWQGFDLTKQINSRVSFHEQTPHGYEKSHIGVITAGNHRVQKYIIDQNSGDEIIFQTNFSNNRKDTLFLTEAITQFFREKVNEYKGDDYIDFVDIKDIPLTRNSVVGNVTERVDTLSRYREPCENISIEQFKSIFKVSSEVVKTISVNARRNMCSCNFFWGSNKQINTRVRLDIYIKPNLRRRVRLLKTKENFIRQKGKISNLFFNEEKNAVAWIKDDHQMLRIEVEKGQVKPFTKLVRFAKAN